MDGIKRAGWSEPAVGTNRVTLEQYSHCHKNKENPFVGGMTQRTPSCCECTEALINPKCTALPAG